LIGKYPAEAEPGPREKSKGLGKFRTIPSSASAHRNCGHSDTEPVSEESSQALTSEVRTAVPGQYLGFSVQVNRMLSHLLAAPEGSTVSLEVLGDVARRDRDGSVLVEEVKNRTSRGNPVANRSLDLWKTLRNWTDAIVDGTIDIATSSFVLHVSGDFSGQIVRAFHDATDESRATTALDLASSELLRDRKTGKPRKLATELKPHVDRVLAEENAESVVKLIVAFRLEHGSPLSRDELLGHLRTKAIGEQALEPTLTHLLGWVKDQTDQLISCGKPATIAQHEFALELLSLVRKFDRSEILTSFAPQPGRVEIEDHLETRTYVRQLEIVDAPHDDQLAAITDYLRAEADRIAWATDGTVHESTYDELEDSLRSAWKNHRTRVNAQLASEPEETRGRVLLAECSLHSVKIQGLDPPDHFCRGCFHALADDLTVGWHPSYKALLSEKEE